MECEADVKINGACIAFANLRAYVPNEHVMLQGYEKEHTNRQQVHGQHRGVKNVGYSEVASESLTPKAPTQGGVCHQPAELDAILEKMERARPTTTA